MNLQQRNNIHVQGDGKQTMIFAHGFGCDQNMWRFMAPRFADRFRVVTLDLVGAGGSDLRAYDRSKYESLQGYAEDLIEIASEYGIGPVQFVGHSVSAMIGMLADLKAPGTFAAHMMIGPSPCYINEGTTSVASRKKTSIPCSTRWRATILAGRATWRQRSWACLTGPNFGAELTASFCRTDPEIAKQFAKVTFMSDNRKDLANFRTPTLIIQSSDDLIAPMAVGEYMHRALPHSMLRVVTNIGHCPHLSAPSESCDAMDEFLATLAQS
jgi:sigma-B regulation protein RsbQ